MKKSILTIGLLFSNGLTSFTTPETNNIVGGGYGFSMKLDIVGGRSWSMKLDMLEKLLGQ
jgi:hypothetical protein